MTADVMVADGLVWMLAHALWLLALVVAYGLGAGVRAWRPAGWRDRELRHLHGEVRRLTTQLAEARQDTTQARAERAGYLHRAEWERNRADAAEARLANVTAGLQRVFDQDTLIRLDAETDWETRP